MSQREHKNRDKKCEKGVKPKRRHGFHNIFMAFASLLPPPQLVVVSWTIIYVYTWRIFDFSLGFLSNIKMLCFCCGWTSGFCGIKILSRHWKKCLWLFIEHLQREEDGSIKNECLLWWKRWGALARVTLLFRSLSCSPCMTSSCMSHIWCFSNFVSEVNSTIRLPHKMLTYCIKY